MNKRTINISILAAGVLLVSSCKKLIEIEPPIDSITTDQVFQNYRQAEAALAGVYSRLINGSTTSANVREEQFSAGLATASGALSSDELFVSRGNSDIIPYVVSINGLTLQQSSWSTAIWKSAYKTIYDANGVIEGIAASTSPNLLDSVRKQYTAEARVIRAFCYFYLINFYGDVPLVLTVDYNKTSSLPRAPQQAVYDQVIKDLTESMDHLPADFSNGNGERIRINKWFAEAFLARVYLYTGQYQLAIDHATNVINQGGLFTLPDDLNTVFLKNSSEAIWQLQQYSDQNLKGAPDGMHFIPESPYHAPRFPMNDPLVGLFEATDKRWLSWVGAIDVLPSGPIYHYPFKYKVGKLEYGAPVEYYTVMRLAELYLIRAEAKMGLSAGNTEEAIADLNVLRHRADIDDLPTTLTAEEVNQAIADERQRELFAEWGHRWFDLKRTGKALDILPLMPQKQPWRGNYQLLYPIPATEIEANNQLIQNPEYDQL